MAGCKSQAWITAVITDKDVSKALVLANSLRRSLTSRTVAVLVCPRISLELRELLNYEFDSIHILEEDRNVPNLKLEDFAKLYALTLRVFEKCVFLSPNMLVMKNCDEIFEKIDSLTFTENFDTSVFAFQPSLEAFKGLKAGLNNGGQGSLEKYLRIWQENQLNKIDYLDSSYNKVLSTTNRTMLRNEKNISIVNFSEDPSSMYASTLGKVTLGLLEMMAIKYWNDIYIFDVQPKVRAALQGSEITTNLSQRKQGQYNREPIAIIGMSCRYPGSNNLDEFWDLLFNGLDAVRTPPDFRWTRDQTTKNRPDCRKTNAGFLKVPVDEFDAKFFGISPKEAVYMDPQHRLLHELVWEGLEDAAVDPLKLRGKNHGIFLGSWTNDMKDILVQSGNKEFYRLYMGNSIGAGAARISHHFGLTGPCVATESGCSSAMVAVHLACRSLLHGETNMAIACGVNLLLHPFDKDEMPMVISPTGRCKTFDSKADGFARAEGCGVLVLKRLSQAVKDNDSIWALIRGSGMSQEGISRSMGTPTVHCEALAMQKALTDACVSPEQISYVEAHGTGTVVGDPMEISAIAAAYNTEKRKEPLFIGSVKTNVGHTESCSGITGIMKVVLALKKEIIPPHRNFETLNPAIDLNAVPATIPLQPVPWPRNSKQARLAGVSSFGITGTDAHAIIEEAPDTPNICANATERPLHILKVSSKTEEALEELLQRYQDGLETLQEDDFPNFAYTANIGRSNFNNRAIIISKSKKDAIEILANSRYMKKEINDLDNRKVCFLFTGQGSQYKSMAKLLYETSPVFRMHFDYCEQLLEKGYNIKIRDALWSPNDSDVSRTMYSQTSIFCVEYALLKLWESWGVKPDYVLGHSLGEFAAAVCANILTVEDAVMLVAERSRLIDGLPHGKMLVIKAEKSSVTAMMRKFSGNCPNKILDYAAINSNQQTVVAGDSQVVQEFFDYCKQNNVKALILEATHAFHSKHMDPMLNRYREVAAKIRKPTRQTCEYISGMRGSVMSPDQLDADYWVQHTRQKVDFLSASKTAFELGCQIFLEVGPQPVLSALTSMNIDGNVMCLPSLKRNVPEWDTLLNSVARLYLDGIEIDWQGFDQFYNRRKIRIPHYPFQGKRHWPDTMASAGNTIHPLLGAVIPNASSTKLFQNAINPRSIEFVKDHQIGNDIIFPGAGYLEMCLAAGHATLEICVDSWTKPTRLMKVENLSIEAPLALDESKTCQIQAVVDFIGTDGSKNDATDWTDISIKIFHKLETEMDSVKWLSHASAAFSPLLTAADKEFDLNLDEIVRTITSEESDDKLIREIYEKLASLGLKFGPLFQSLEKVWKDEQNNGLLAQVKVPQEDQSFSQYIMHPVILDAAIQAIMLKKHSDKIKRKLHVPISIGKFVWFSSLDLNDKCFIYAYDSRSDKSSGTTSLIINQDGKLLGAMSNVEFIDTTVKAVQSVLEQQTSAMPDLWEESWRPKLGPLQHRIPQSILTNENIYSNEVTGELEKTYNFPSLEMEESFSFLEEYVYNFMLNALYECGWKPDIGGVLTTDSLMKQLNIISEHQLFVKYFIQVFEEEGLVTFSKKSNAWHVVKTAMSHEDVKLKLESSVFTEDLVKKFDPTRLIAQVGKHLSDILLGKQSGLSILFPESQKNLPTVGDFYETYGKYFNILPLIGSFIELRAKSWNEMMKNNNGRGKYVYRVCEIGAGTGVFSGAALNALSKHGVDFEYTYTDISPAFFTGAEKRFEKYVKDMKFKKLNIEECPISQGFTPGYYDLVIASDVIHATKDVTCTLQNIRKLLRDGGNVDIMEQTKKNRIITFIFGIVNGFWRFEDEVRKDHCIIPKDQWQRTLKDAGFHKSKLISAFQNRHGYITGWATKQPVEIVRFPQSSSKKPVWVVFTLPGLKVGNFVCDELVYYGRDVIRVIPKSDEGHVDASSSYISVHDDKREDFVNLIEKITAEGIVFLWPLDKTKKEQSELLQPLLYLVQSIPQMKQKLMPRVYVVTEGIIPIEDNDLSHHYPSTLWGFVKTMRNEHTDINCRGISLPTNFGEPEMQELFFELWAHDGETQVAFARNSRHVARFQPLKSNLQDLALPNGTDRFQLILPETKSIGDLQFGPLDHFDLERGEVEIQVKASALNFRDVFSVLKPTEAFKNINSVGFDFAGVVKRSLSNKWKPGDFVFGVNIDKQALPSHIKLSEDDVLRVPEEMTLCEAATMPAVFATAYYCLIDVAKIKPTDTVLIHTASGGVGLSAIEICKHVGATIIATAGSKRKQNFLRALGIQHIFHSRNTEYSDQILKVTNGRGVDVVLNSLTSEGFKEATLKACAQGARFIEMSKLSIWQPAEVKELRADCQYTIVDVSSVDPEEWRRLMKNLSAFLEKKIVHPIPYVRFDGTNIREALRYLQKAKHIGKVVCLMPELRMEREGLKVYTQQFNDRSTYLITGGLGGIGFEVAKWMLSKGAKNIILAGRSPPSKLAQETIDKLNSSMGANVISVQLDISDRTQCKELLSKIKSPNMNMPPLRGIMHAAGTLSDGLISNQKDWGKFSSTFNTKVNGTLNLHELTKEYALEHFVLFSSVASLFGSPGQSNHAAGNNFEDTFTHYRHSYGLPATSINWGQWGQVGIATEVDLPGMKALSTLQGLTALEYALKTQRVQTCVLNMESFVLFSKLSPQIAVYLDEKIWKSTSSSGSALIIRSDEFWQEYDTKGSREDKLDVMKNRLKGVLKFILKLDEDEIVDENTNFQEMGVDSLMFVEIKNALQNLLGERITVTASALRDCNTVQVLSHQLIKLIEGEDMEHTKAPTREEIDALLKEDTVLPEEITADGQNPACKTSEIQNVLLTGPTGQLGPYILYELCRMPQIKNIYCLVRPMVRHGEINSQDRLMEHLESLELLPHIDASKLHCVEGNLVKERLGIEEAKWNSLAEDVDAIFHCAIRADHIQYYKKRNSGDEDVRSVNIEGLLNVLHLACSHKIKHVFHSSSLLSVPTTDAEGRISEDWPDIHDYDGLTLLAYPISKFIGDVLLKKAVDKGIPCKVFRFPLIAGNSKSGRSVSIHHNHLMLRYFYILKCGRMPSNPIPLALIPVDTCANVSIRIFFDPRAASSDIYNITHDKPDLDQAFPVIAQELGYPVEIVEFAEFAKLIENEPEDSAYSMFKQLYRSDEEDLMETYTASKAIRKWMEGEKNFWLSRKVSELFPDYYKYLESPIKCLYRDLQFANEAGYFEKFGLGKNISESS